MERRLIAACAAAILGAALAGWSGPSPGSGASTGSMDLSSLMSSSIFQQLGGKEKVAGLANEFVSSSVKDPLLARLTGGKNIDTAATSEKVSSQLCAMLGGGCKAPLTDSQVTSAASKVSPEEATAISQHFSSSLEHAVSNPAVRAAVIKALGSKLPGVLTGFL